MALNKFYDAINATLTLPQNEAFELAERGDGRTLENRMDAESNQAMFEIAETTDAEDYNNAIKFFDRLMRLEQLQDNRSGCRSIQARISSLSKSSRESAQRRSHEKETRARARKSGCRV